MAMATASLGRFLGINNTSIDDLPIPRPLELTAVACISLHHAGDR